MTGFGFALFWIAAAVAILLHDPHGFRQSRWQVVAGFSVAVGIVCMLIGITIWLWENMP